MQLSVFHWSRSLFHHSHAQTSDSCMIPPVHGDDELPSHVNLYVAAAAVMQNKITVIEITSQQHVTSKHSLTCTKVTVQFTQSMQLQQATQSWKRSTVLLHTVTSLIPSVYCSLSLILRYWILLSAPQWSHPSEFSTTATPFLQSRSSYWHPTTNVNAVLNITRCTNSQHHAIMQ